ncbi:hypothetical protein ONZ45_g7975 [Pleurotus djamor]|nr:hypothetical protein ONZ45_g7975 [Pleurotus djamor]
MDITSRQSPPPEDEDANTIPPPEDIDENEALGEAPVARFFNGLRPPPTLLHSTQSFTPFTNQHLRWGSTTIHTFSWSIDAYIYPVNAWAHGEGDFTARGGSVIVVLVSNIPGTVHGGWVRNRFCQYNISMRTGAGSGLPSNAAPRTTNHQPHATPYDQYSGWIRRYPISYSEPMHLFLNGVEDTQTFDAQYQDAAQIHRGELRTLRGSPTSVEWEVEIWHPLQADAFRLTSIAVFGFDTLSEATFDLTVRGLVRNQFVQEVKASITVDARFNK